MCDQQKKEKEKRREREINDFLNWPCIYLLLENVKNL